MLIALGGASSFVSRFVYAQSMSYPRVTLGPDPVLQYLELPSVAWRTSAGDVRIALGGSGLTPMLSNTEDSEVVVASRIAGADAMVRFKFDRSSTPLLIGVDVNWAVPALLTEAKDRFNTLLRGIDVVSGSPHTVREGGRYHGDTVSTLPVGRGLLARHFVTWGRGARHDADRTMVMTPDGTIRLSLGPNQISVARAESEERRQSRLERYPAAPGTESAVVEAYQLSASLDQDLCTEDLPFADYVRNAQATFVIDADGIVESVEARYSWSPDSRVSRTLIDSALMRWARTCRPLPAVGADRRVRSTLRTTLTGWIRGVGFR